MPNGIIYIEISCVRLLRSTRKLFILVLDMSRAYYTDILILDTWRFQVSITLRYSRQPSGIIFMCTIDARLLRAQTNSMSATLEADLTIQWVSINGLAIAQISSWTVYNLPCLLAVTF